jgi:hypothetical protein
MHWEAVEKGFHRRIGLAKRQFTVDKAPADVQQAKAQVEEWMRKNNQPPFQIHGWRAWVKNHSVFTVVEARGEPHSYACYDDVCGRAYSHGANQSTIYRHFGIVHPDRRCADEGIDSETRSLVKRGQTISRSILRSSDDVKIGVVIGYLLSTASPFTTVENRFFRSLVGLNMKAETIGDRIDITATKVVQCLRTRYWKAPARQLYALTNDAPRARTNSCQS